MPPQARRPTIVVVASDVATRAALETRLEAAGFKVRALAGAAAILADSHLAEAGGLVVDHDLDHSSGLDLLVRLRPLGSTPPAILVSNGLLGSASARAAELAIPVVERALVGDHLAVAVRLLARRLP